METQSNTAYVFEGDSSTGFRGQGQVFDRYEPYADLPYMYEDVAGVTIKDLIDQATKNFKKEYKENRDAPPSRIVLKLDIGSRECDVILSGEKSFIEMENMGYVIVM